MAKFNHFERGMAIYLRRFPRLKAVMKFIFQMIMLIVYKKGKNVWLAEKIKSITSVDSRYETFFGYYGQPVVSNGRRLFHESSLRTSKSPRTYCKTDSTVDVVCHEIGSEGKGEIFRYSTRAFNWQQGSKLTWIDKNRFVFNDIDQLGVAYARVVDLSQGTSFKLQQPFYELVNNKQYISLGYEAITRLNPDYGYFHLTDQAKGAYISIVNFNGTEEERWSIEDVNNQLGITGNSSEYCLNHASVSPEKTKMIAIHRGYPGGVRRDCLIYLELNRSIYRFSMLVDSGMVSHFAWLDDERLLCYLRYGEIEGYHIVSIRSEVTVERLEIKGLSDFGDGHPIVLSPNEFITDTYPNKARIKSLILVNIKKQKFEVLGRFYEPLKYNPETRCDLHPRYDFESNSVYIDSDHTGKRHLYVLQLEE